MSTTLVLDPLQQQQTPPMVMAHQQGYTSHSGHGSIGPVIGVLAVITVLGVVAVMIGRLCSGRRVMGRGRFDFESWVETKCASCIDGHVFPPPPPPRRMVAENSTISTAVVQEEQLQEIKQEETSDRQDHQHGKAEI